MDKNEKYNTLTEPIKIFLLRLCAIIPSITIRTGFFFFIIISIFYCLSYDYVTATFKSDTHSPNENGSSCTKHLIDFAARFAPNVRRTSRFLNISWISLFDFGNIIFRSTDRTRVTYANRACLYTYGKYKSGRDRAGRRITVKYFIDSQRGTPITLCFNNTFDVLVPEHLIQNLLYGIF